MINIRREKPGDIQDIYNINAGAFGREAEGELVDALRGEVSPFISLVAEEDGRVIGHILFTPVRVGESGVNAAGLGPMSVAPGSQSRGVGTLLIKKGLESCREQGMDAVFVLGHPEYYTKFGFKQSSLKGIYWKGAEYAPYFFFLELKKDALDGVRGEVLFNPHFDEV